LLVLRWGQGVLHHFSDHGKCDGFDAWKRKKGYHGVFLFSLYILLFLFFFNEKKEAIVFVCWSIFSSARPGWGRAVVFYVGSIYWALVFFFLICSIVMMAILAVFGGGSE
jgi:hypothetical protein